MAQQTINIGTTANDGTGDTIRAGGDKINQNFTEVYAAADGFSSVAAMVAYDVSGFDTGDTLRLKGYYADGDFGQPIVLVVEAAAAGVLSHTLSDGRYGNLYVDGPVNVKWFGAKGDGTTDDSSTFQSAVNAASHLFIPDASFVISSKVDVNAPIKIENRGILLRGGVTNSIFNVTTSGFTIIGGELEGQDALVTLAGSDAAYTSASAVQSALGSGSIGDYAVRPANPGSSLKAIYWFWNGTAWAEKDPLIEWDSGGSTFSGGSGCFVQDVKFDNFFPRAIRTSNMSDVTFAFNEFNGIDLADNFAIRVSSYEAGTSGIKIIGNRTTNSTILVSGFNFDNKLPEDIIISDNSLVDRGCISVRGIGAIIKGNYINPNSKLVYSDFTELSFGITYDSAYGGLIADNFIENITFGIEAINQTITGQTDAKSLVISGNNVVAPVDEFQKGIVVNMGATDLCSSVVVVGNVLRDCDIECYGTTTYYLKNLSVVGNSCYMNTEEISGNPNEALYLAYVQDAVVSGNSFMCVSATNATSAFRLLDSQNVEICNNVFNGFLSLFSNGFSVNTGASDLDDDTLNNIHIHHNSFAGITQGNWRYVRNYSSLTTLTLGYVNIHDNETPLGREIKAVFTPQDFTQVETSATGTFADRSANYVSLVTDATGKQTIRCVDDFTNFNLSKSVTARTSQFAYGQFDARRIQFTIGGVPVVGSSTAGEETRIIFGKDTTDGVYGLTASYRLFGIEIRRNSGTGAEEFYGFHAENGSATYTPILLSAPENKDRYGFDIEIILGNQREMIFCINGTPRGVIWNTVASNTTVDDGTGSLSFSDGITVEQGKSSTLLVGPITVEQIL